ncbi:MAG: protein serine/threonine phosphatase [Bacteroidetes bacterium]|nr:protein serine/threonine phosphatase [Bacteroidota bacterium]
MRYFISLICFVLCLNLFSQRDRSIDSLLRILKTLNAKAGDPSLKDTSRVNVLVSLSRKCSFRGDHSTAIKHARIAENISNKLIEEGFSKEGKKCLADAISSLGYAYYTYEDIPNSTREYKRELKIRQELGDPKDLAMCYNYIGTNYLVQENNPVAMEFFFKALKLMEETNNKNEIATVYNSLGVCFTNQNEYDKALEYYKKEQAIGELIKDKDVTSMAVTNIGAVYGEKGEHPKALEYFMKYLKLVEKTDNVLEIALAYVNIGSTYESMNEHEKALEYSLKARDMLEQQSNRQYQYLGLVYLNTGTIYTSMIKKGIGNRQKNIQEASSYLNKALETYQRLGLPTYIGECYKAISEFNTNTGKMEDAFQNYKKYIQYKDSVTNAENTSKSIRIEMNYEFEKKESASNLEQEKKETIAKEENEKQKTIRNLFIVAFGFMLLLAIFIFISYRQKKQVNSVISKQKLEVEEQKSLVERNQKQIIDSINYAKRIQSSILPNDTILKKVFTESFILYRPKDIVSGDFYWFCSLPDSKEMILAVADCTGHGVPGAFLSMVGSTLLNEIVTHKNITDPAEILKALCSGLSSTLVSKQKEEINPDGMDISICKIDSEKKRLMFAGANQTLYLVGNGKVEKTESQINSINGVFDLRTNDQLYSIGVDLSDITAVYLTTDGFADQMGELTKKKFLSTRFEDLLLKVHNLSANEQLSEIENTFNTWKGNQKQIDDVLVIGFKV